MKTKLIAVIFLFAFSLSFSLSQENIKLNPKLGTMKASIDGSDYLNEKSPIDRIKSDLANSTELSSRSRLICLSNDLDSTQPTDKLKTGSQKEKSVWIGMGLSALVPGAGEFYAKDYLKAAIFFGIEVASWITYYYFQHTGNVKTNEFQDYANKYWDIHTYGRWLKDQGFQGSGDINPDEPNWQVLQSQIHQCESQNFSHTLPDYGTQQYYELIGKYQNFQAGWTNLSHVPTKDPGPYYYETYKDPVFVNYADNRQTANNYYNKGTTMAMIIVANHVLSIGDAAWTVTTFNKKLKMQTGFRIGTYYSPYTFEEKTMPKFNLQVTF